MTWPWNLDYRLLKENGTIPKPEHGLLFAFHSNMALCCIIFEIKRDIGRKSWFFSYPTCIRCPVMGSPLKYCHNVWYWKLERCGYPTVKKFQNSRFDTIHECDGHQTNGQTDRQIRHDIKGRAYAWIARQKSMSLTWNDRYTTHETI